MSDSSRLPARPSLLQLQKQAKDLLKLCRAGDFAALARLRAAGCSPPFHLAGAQLVVSREYGFETWAKLKHHVELMRPESNASQFFRIGINGALVVRGPLSDADWDVVCDVLNERRIARLDTPAMTDAGMERVARSSSVTSLYLGNSDLMTDRGLLCLARMPQLQELDISGARGQITGAGLSVLRHLPGLRTFQACWQPRLSDAGMTNLTFCGRLETVNLLGTYTGDGAIQALEGIPSLRYLKTGRAVTGLGLSALHRLPAFKTWMGGEVRYGLMRADSEPNHLLIDGPFPNRALDALEGLDGLSGLSFFRHTSELTGAGLAPLKHLPRLVMLGCEGKTCDDEAMRHISAMPHLRMLMAQGTIATGRGFDALSRSRSIEYLWGRECPNLTAAGFTALSAMPALRGLAVSCRNVGDAALARLPHFPSLAELMPMDVSDDGFRHVGRCERLEALWCMYCRDTGDLATEHIAGLSQLRSYYAGQTLITDRSLHLLAGMPSLERIELWNCSAVTGAGVRALAVLPRLREVMLHNLPGVAREALAPFSPGVSIDLSD